MFVLADQPLARQLIPEKQLQVAPREHRRQLVAFAAGHPLDRRARVLTDPSVGRAEPGDDRRTVARSTTIRTIPSVPRLDRDRDGATAEA
ncbi:MAG: hypothetical protein ACREUE_16840 [Panacagrimonas sp.]